MGLEKLLDFDGLNIKNYKKTIDEDNKEYYAFEATSSSLRRPFCPCCGSFNVYSDGYRQRKIQDLPLHGYKVIINVTVRKYNCKDCNKTFQEDLSPFVDKSANISNRLKETIAKEAVSATFAQASFKYDVSNTTAKNVFEDWTDSLDEEKKNKIKAPEILGIDEAHLAKKMRGVFIDSHNGLLLDLTQDRNIEVVKDFIKSLDGYKNIKAVTMDMWAQYRKAVYDTIGKDVCVIVDRFHVIQDLNKKVGKARGAIIENAGNPKLSKNHSNLMKMNIENLNNDQKMELFEGFAIVPELGTLYGLKESFRSIYNCKTKEEALEYYDRWCKQIPEKIKDPTADPKKRKSDRFDYIRRFQSTVEKWKKEIFNYFDYRETNAATEAINGLLKIMNRQGKGYGFEVLRKKALYSIKATTKEEPKPKKSENLMMGYAMMHNFIGGYNMFDYDTPKPDITNGNLTPRISDILKAIEDGTINFDYDKENDNG